jgi:hypothetical protein
MVGQGMNSIKVVTPWSIQGENGYFHLISLRKVVAASAFNCTSLIEIIRFAHLLP